LVTSVFERDFAQPQPQAARASLHPQNREAAMPSTAIGKIEYDAKTHQLWVSFVTNGRRYAYFDVPFETYDAFRHAFSKGTFFNQHIRDQYECELVYDPKAIVSSPARHPRT
jgi:hypothetical protein